MYTHLSAGGNIGLQQLGPHDATAAATLTRDATAVFMNQWFRTDRAIVMYLSNGTLQVCMAPNLQRFLLRTLPKIFSTSSQVSNLVILKLFLTFRTFFLGFLITF